MQRGSYCWVVNAARLAVSAPWIVLLLLGTQSSTLTAYNSGRGACYSASARGLLPRVRIMLGSAELPEEQRVLR